jgi:hypothetical protein
MKQPRSRRSSLVLRQSCSDESRDLRRFWSIGRGREDRLMIARALRAYKAYYFGVAYAA